MYRGHERIIICVPGNKYLSATAVLRDTGSYPPHVEQRLVRKHDMTHSLSAVAHDQLLYNAPAQSMMALQSEMCKKLLFFRGYRESNPYYLLMLLC